MVATIGVGINPYGIGYDSDNGRMYVANFNSKTVSVIDTSTNKVVATIKVFDTPWSVAYSAANGVVYVTHPGGGPVNPGVYEIDSSNNVLFTDNLDVGNGPIGIAYDPVHGRMYVTNQGSNDVSVVPATSLSTQLPSNNDNNNNNTKTIPRSNGEINVHAGNSIAITGSANGGNGILNGMGGNGGHTGSATSTGGNVINGNDNR